MPLKFQPVSDGIIGVILAFVLSFLVTEPLALANPEMAMNSQSDGSFVGQTPHVIAGSMSSIMVQMHLIPGLLGRHWPLCYRFWSRSH